MVLLELITAITFIFGGNSYHFDRNPDMNEKNNMKGIELRLEDSNYRPFVKWFDNSFNQPSKTIGFNYLKCTDGTLKLCGGYTTGIVEGYKDGDINPFPMIAPYASLEFKNLELGVGCLTEACIYELKLKIYF